MMMMMMMMTLWHVTEENPCYEWRDTPLGRQTLFFCNPILFAISTSTFGARISVVTKALCYKLEGRGFDSR
jgi:hypothetical protein